MDERNPLVKRSVWSGGGQVVAVVDEVPRLPVPPLPLYDELGVHHAAHTALVLRSDVKGGVDPAIIIQYCAGHS